MVAFICDHCLTNLGEVVDGVDQPHCLDHPDGSVSIHEVGDAENI